MASSIPLTTTETLSGLSGSISIACWVFLLAPQLYENFRNSSADGLSLSFLLIWFLGDITNLAGAIWGGLLGTVVALGLYFTLADFLIISQVVFYQQRSKKRAQEQESDAGNGKLPTEETGLLAPSSAETQPARKKSRGPSFTEGNVSLPGSQLRRTSTQSSHQARAQSSSSLPPIVEDSLPKSSTGRAWLKNAVSVVAIILAGSLGWLIAYKTNIWTPTPLPGSKHEAGAKSMPLGAELLGYASAVCYLGARIPQIIKNQREKSCEGLSLLFFILSLLGNASYGAGILFHSRESGYVMDNLPWLVGSLGTMAEDAYIFWQFSYYGDGKRPEGGDEEETDVAVMG